MSEEQNDFIGSIPRAVLRTVLVRAGIVAVCAACVGLVYWSLTFRLQPVNREVQAATLELSRLNDSVEQLRQDGSSDAAGMARTNFLSAQAALFARPEHFRAWQSQVRRRAAALALETKVTLEPARPYPGAEAKLAFTRAVIEVTPMPATGAVTNAPPYNRLLKFAHGLAPGDRRWDLTGLTVEGSLNSVTTARMEALLLTEPKEAK